MQQNHKIHTNSPNNQRLIEQQDDSFFLTGANQIEERVPTPAKINVVKRQQSIVDSPTTRQACKNIGIKFEDLQHQTLEEIQERLKIDNSQMDMRDIVQTWKNYEESRRENFANVMMERRRLKQLQNQNNQSTIDTTNTSIKDNRGLQPKMKMQTPQAKNGTGLIQLNSTANRSRFPQGPKELVEIEKMRLQQIMEQERENMRIHIEKEIKRLEQQEQAEIENFKMSEEYKKQKEQRDRQALQHREKVRQMRLKEQEEFEQQRKQQSDEYIQRRRLEERSISDERKKAEFSQLQMLKEKESVILQSSTKTQSRKQKILEEHLEKLEQKKKQLVDKETEKFVSLQSQFQDRRARSTVRQQEIDHKLNKVLSKSELLEKQRKEKKEELNQKKFQKIESIKQAIEKDKQDFRESLSANMKFRIQQAKKAQQEQESKRAEHITKRIEDQEMKLSEIISKLKKEQNEAQQKKLEKHYYREQIVEQAKKEQDQQRNEKKQHIVQQENEFTSIIQQRERIRDQIKSIKKKFELERQQYIDDLRTATSKEQRNRIIVKVSKNGKAMNDFRSQQHSPVNNRSLSNVSNQMLDRKPSLNSSLFVQY